MGTVFANSTRLDFTSKLSHIKDSQNGTLCCLA